jgi:hypothetical protein
MEELMMTIYGFVLEGDDNLGGGGGGCRLGFWL